MKDLKVYAAYPAFAFQHDVASDNDKMSAIHRFRRFVGNQRLQKLNEFSRRHVVGLIASHVAAVLIVLLILRLCGKLPEGMAPWPIPVEDSAWATNQYDSGLPPEHLAHDTFRPVSTILWQI